MRHIFPLMFVLFFGVALTSAQQSTVTVEASFSTLGSPPVPVDLPLPKKDAKNRSIGGVITVVVTVDEKGMVSSVDAGDGPHPFCKTAKDPAVLAIRATAVSAARKAVFKPATFEGKPVAATGFLRYDFPPPVLVKDTDSSGGIQEMRLDRLTKLGATDDTSGARVVGENNGNGSAGVLNGKAEALPQPSYPPAAKAVRAGGTVPVQVIIAEDGTIHSAASISGHPLLRRASEVAACGSRFSPTLLEGQPVKVSGIITYNFVP
ncbi:MAG: energy transducer TonB [Pyrinomonadaceae bacterium]